MMAWQAASLNDEPTAMSTDGEVANALVCKTSIRGFNSLSVLQSLNRRMRAKLHPETVPTQGHLTELTSIA
ncbi:MAG: hypothetical protein JWP98_1733 [Edaphobacter sp.]|nr:hypothetical protein [Edaphobacter sp.]